METFSDSPVAGLKVSSCLPLSKKWVWLSVSDTVEKGLATLSENHILSVPLQKQNQFVGNVDIWDIVMVLIARINTEKKTLEDAAHMREFFTKDLGYVLEVSRNWRKAENPYVDTDLVVSATESLTRLINLFWGGYHRLPVALGNGQFGFVSQSDVVRFAAMNMNLILGPDVVGLSLSELGYKFDKKKMIVCSLDDTTLHCFTRCVQEKISAVGIVNKDGQLVATLSTSDLRGVTTSNLADVLNLPVGDFLRVHSGRNREYAFPEGVQGLVQYGLAQTCRPTDTFELVVYKMVALRIHRLWAVNNKGEPVGVVSLGDLMKTLLLGKPA